MTELKACKVVAMLPRQGGSGGSVQTERLGTLEVPDANSWSRLAACFASHSPAAVQTAVGQRDVILAWPADRDAVVGISDPDAEQRVAVHLRRRPSLLYLDTWGACFAQLLETVHAAMHTKAKLVVAVFPGGQLIEDAYLEPSSSFRQ